MGVERGRVAGQRALRLGQLGPHRQSVGPEGQTVSAHLHRPHGPGVERPLQRRRRAARLRRRRPRHQHLRLPQLVHRAPASIQYKKLILRTTPNLDIS